MRIALLFLAGCIGSDAGKTLVYALDDAPQGRIDRDLCATGVGLNYTLNLENALSYSVAPDGRDALLGTCTIDGSGQVSQCFSLTPDVVLTIADDGALVGDQSVRVTIEDSDCSGADLDVAWRLELDEGGAMTAVADSTWHLDQTAECEDFESDVIGANANGLGIEGCEVQHTMSGTLSARCTINASGVLNCSAP